LPADPPEPTPGRRLTLSLAFGALALATVISSGHRYANDFVFDDVHVIADGSVIHDPSNLVDIWTRHTMFASVSDPGDGQAIDTYRPVPITLFVVDAMVSGREPWAYHTTNLLLHLGCVWGVFLLALLWLDDRVAALYGALVFAVHPWAVEAHVWINGRSDPACLLFGLAGMLALLHAERRGGHLRLSALSGFALLLGLLSKETLLLVFPAILFMPAARGATRSWRARLGPLLFAGLAYLGARVAVLDGMRTHRDTQMLFDAAAHLPWLLLDALRQTVAPERPYLRSLSGEYADLLAWQIALAAIVVVAVLTGAFLARKKAPLAAWTALWFFAPLLPISIISTVLWPGFGRYLYVPLAGFGWLLASLTPVARAKLPRKRLRVSLAALHVVLLAALAALFTRDLQSSEALYGAAMRARPAVAMPHGWLGMALAREGDHRRAVVPLMRAAELDPSTHRYLIHAGRSVIALGQREDAQLIAERGIHRFYGRPEEGAYHLLAVNAMTARDPTVAVGHLVRCLEVWPDRPDCAQALEVMLEQAPDRVENQAALRALLAEP